MTRKTILIHSLVFSPDAVSTAYLYNDIAIGLADAGYKVVVITTTPHYNVIQLDTEKQPLKKRWGGLYYTSYFNGILVYHVPQKKFKSFLARITGFFYWHFVSSFLGLLQKNISLILSPSPPLTIGFVSLILAKIKGAKSVYNVQEIYPDLLVNYGKLKSKFTLNLLRKLERYIYDHSDKVVTIDQVFYNTIVNRFADPSRLVIIPNFVDTDLYQPVINNTYSLDPKLFPVTNSLKLMYAGNIGHAQDWQPLVELAERLKNEKIEFWVIGEGVLKKKIEKEIADKGLYNIHLLSYQPRETMASIIGFADIHFIFMNPLMDGQGFPSKVYTIMACGKPVLVASGENTPLCRFLQKKNCAYLITEPDLNDKCNKIVSILQAVNKDKSLASSLGQNGRSIVLEQYSKKTVINQYLQLINNLVGLKS